MYVIRIGGKKGKWEADKKKDFSTIFFGKPANYALEGFQGLLNIIHP